MATQRRPGPQRASRAGAAALPRTRRAVPARVRLRLLPSRSSLAVGLALVALAGLAYVLARETSAFAVRRIEVEGAQGPVAAEVRRALAPLLGTSLLGLDGGALERRVESLPTVLGVRYDRAFPHTLRVEIVSERPVAVLRLGNDAWLVSARGRVVERAVRSALPALPRIWLPAALRVGPGAFLAPDGPGAAARALAFAQGFPARIATAAFAHGSLVFRLASGVELRLGDPSDLPLKLAVARRALAVLPAGSTYLDVSLPGRPVAGTNAKLSGGG